MALLLAAVQPTLHNMNAARSSQGHCKLAAPPVRQQRRQERRRALPVAAAATTTLARTQASSLTSRKLERAQQAVLDAVAGVQGRGKGGMTPEQQAAFEEAVAVLEADGGVPAPTASPLLEGRWRLLFTTRPGTASPIQRTFTAVDSFAVYQDIELEGGEEGPRVCQVVEFGSAGFLKVEAEASTDSQPLPGFTPRQGKGLPFGLLGVSSSEPPARSDMRVDFQFDRAAFNFSALPFSVPYPVPFRLLGDERKGWIDVTYLSPDGSLRLSRGNKGTLFVLQKEVPPKQQLLAALARGGADGERVARLAAEVAAAGGGEAAPAASPAAVGTWRLVWTQQGATANPLQKALAGQVENFQIISADGRLENLVCLAPWLRVRACAACAPEAGGQRTAVDIDSVALELGGLRVPLPVKTDGRGFVEWLYLDRDLRISRGNKGSTFIHTREA